MSGAVRFDAIGTGVQQARTAAAAAPGAGVREFADLGAYGVLLAGRSDGELLVLAALLDPLAEAGDDELVAALEAFLRHHGHLEAAAAALGVHRHTMRNRMRRVGERLGDDLESVDTRTQLWMALQARRVLAERGQSPRAGGAQR